MIRYFLPPYDAHKQKRKASALSEPVAVEEERASAPVASTSASPTHRAPPASTGEASQQLQAEEASCSKRTKREGKQKQKAHFTAQDYLVPFANPGDVEAWYNVHKRALANRNFYVLQQHHATAKHFDLRIQCGGATISWAIPRGLSGLDTIQAEQQGYAEAPPKRAGEAQHLRKYSGLRASKRKSFKPVRLAIETNPHSISYTMFEGGGIGTTAVWDIGTYTVHTSKQRREAGYDDSDGESDDELDAAYDEGSKQEHKLYKALHRCWFLDTPPSGDTLAMPFNVRTPAEQDTGKSQSISIELKGARFKKLRITLSRASKDINNVGKRTWMVRHSGSEAPIEDTSLGERSILSGRTMDEVKADRAQEEARMKDAMFQRLFHDVSRGAVDEEYLAQYV